MTRNFGLAPRRPVAAPRALRRVPRALRGAIAVGLLAEFLVCVVIVALYVMA
jgi:hypothetical protein